MRFAVIVSKKDAAGLTIKDALLNEGFARTEDSFEGSPVFEAKLENHQVNLYTAQRDSVHCENLDREIDADIFMFATKHQSAAGIHSFSVHPIGNFGKAEFGGKDRTLCVSPAFYLKTGYQLLAKNNTLNHEIIQESTHHGPYMEKPSMFIEIGSSHEEWTNPKAGRILGKTIIELISTPAKQYKAAFGIGGLHHSPNFRQMILESDISLAHLCPKHHLENLNEALILQAIEKSSPKCELVVLDWKGLGTHKERISCLLSTINIEVIKLKSIKNQ